MELKLARPPKGIVAQTPRALQRKTLAHAPQPDRGAPQNRCRFSKEMAHAVLAAS